MAKNASFHIKSPVKNFHGWAKGGTSHRAPLKYATGSRSIVHTQTLGGKFCRGDFVWRNYAWRYVFGNVAKSNLS